MSKHYCVFTPAGASFVPEDGIKVWDECPDEDVIFTFVEVPADRCDAFVESCRENPDVIALQVEKEGAVAFVFSKSAC